ncbi:hypothetical protein KI387_023372, partial [Taxus chinensis]
TLGSCKSLNWLRMEKNYLNGSIPAGLLNLPELDLMELQNNDLSGNLTPDGIEVSQKLSQRNLSHNRLTGSLPRGIGNFTGLQSIRSSSRCVVYSQVHAHASLTFEVLFSNYRN